MASAVPFDRETLLDLTVNAIPLGIMLFFIALFVLVNPFGSDPVGTVIQLTIVVVTFMALFILTYVSGKAISEAEKEMEEKGYAGVSESVGAEAVAGELEDAPDEDAPELEGETDDTSTEAAEADDEDSASDSAGARA
jgi:hypothetical protein